MKRFELLSTVIASAPTGSRVIAPSTVTHTTDEDFVLLVTSKNAAVRELSTLGYTETTNGAYEDNNIVTLRSVSHAHYLYDASQALHNLILVDSSQAFKRWVVATHVAKELGLTDKGQRIMLFSAIKSGGMSVDDNVAIDHKMAESVAAEARASQLSFIIRPNAMPINGFGDSCCSTF